MPSPPTSALTHLRKTTRPSQFRIINDQIYPKSADLLTTVGVEVVAWCVQPGVFRSATMGVEAAGLKPELVGSNDALSHVGVRKSSAGSPCGMLLGGQARRQVKHPS